MGHFEHAALREFGRQLVDGRIQEREWRNDFRAGKLSGSMGARVMAREAELSATQLDNEPLAEQTIEMPVTQVAATTTLEAHQTAA